MAITIIDGFLLNASSPLDYRQVLTKQQMLSVEDYGMPDVYFAICKDDGKFYLYNKSNISNSDTGKFVACNMKDSYTKTEVDDLLKTINHRVTSFPTPSADEEGKLYQYIGVTDNKYTYGHFYTCELMTSYNYVLKSDITSSTTGTFYNSDGTIVYSLPTDYADGTSYYERVVNGTYYSWNRINIQPTYDSAIQIKFDDTNFPINAKNVQEAIREVQNELDTITIEKTTSSDSTYSAYYNLMYNGVPVGDTIRVLNQLVVNSGEIKECTQADDPITGLNVGDTYIDLVLADGKNTHIYIKVSDLTSKYLNDLSDVQITTPQDGQYLTYNATTRCWENSTFVVQPSFSFTDYSPNTDIEIGKYYVYNNELYQALSDIQYNQNLSFDATKFKLVIGGGSNSAISIASSTKLGGIKVGNHLSISTDGTLSVDVDNTKDANSTNPITNNLFTTEIVKKLNKPSNTPVSGQVLAINDKGNAEWKSLPSGAVGLSSINTNLTPDVNGNINLDLDVIPDGTNRKLTNHWVGTKQELTNLISSGNYDANCVYETTDENDVSPIVSVPQVDIALNSTSNNAIANSTVTNALNGKIDKPSVDGSPNQFYGLNEYGVPVWKDSPVTVDSSLSTSSTNPVENKVVTNELNKKITSPTTTGTTGQVLTLDDNGNPIWKDTGSASGTVQSVNTIQPDSTGDVNITIDNIPDGAVDGNGVEKKVFKKWQGTKAELDALGTYEENVDYVTTDEENTLSKSLGILVSTADVSSYNTKENVVGQWFGKDLYRKCFYFDTAITFSQSSNTTTTKSISLAYGDTNNIDYICDVKLIARYSPELGTAYYDLLNYNENTNINNIVSTISHYRTRKVDGYIYIDVVFSNFATARTFNNYYAIIEYVKK